MGTDSIPSQNDSQCELREKNSHDQARGSDETPSRQNERNREGETKINKRRDGEVFRKSQEKSRGINPLFF